MDALAEEGLALLIDRRGNLHVLLILAPLQVSHVGRLLLGDEVDDVLLAETLQDEVDLLGLQGTLLGDEALVDEVVVHE